MKWSRRKFLGTSVAGSSGLLLKTPGALYRTNPSIQNMNSPFELKLLATNWGFSGTLDEFASRIKKEGYDGMEIWWPLEKKNQDEMFAALKKYDLSVGFLCGGWQSNWQEHLDYFKKMINEAAKNQVQTPLYINCHSGRDHFSFEQNRAFIEHTLQLSRETGILICHETHRSRILFAAPVCMNYINQYPDLKLTFDVSHWCNVHESLLQDQAETMDQVLRRVEHIHARIGHPEGPQVNDPRAPEWKNALDAHLAWWDKVLERKKKTGGRITFLTEFGPPDYLPTLPYTRQPVASQWEINGWMRDFLRKRYL